MRKTATLFLVILVVLLVSCSFSSDIIGDAVRVEWIREDTYHDDKEFKDYTPFKYNGVYYKEIPTYGENDDFAVYESNYWSIDPSQMRILGKMKIRNNSSAYPPPEVSFMYQYYQVYAFPQEENEPDFIYCDNHLWTRDYTVILSPIESAVNGYILFRRVRDSHSLTYKLEKIKTIDGPVTIRELFDFNTQRMVPFNSNFFDLDFDLTDCYQLSFHNSEYPFLYSGVNVAKLKNNKWYWVQETEKAGYYRITEVVSKWVFDDWTG